MPWISHKRPERVKEAEATGRTLEIFNEIKQALGLPRVPSLYQRFAALPKFLELHWEQVQAYIRSRQLFEAAERLRGEAYTRMHNYFRVPDLQAELVRQQFSPGAMQEIARVVELFHYETALVLLIATAQLRAFDESVDGSGKGTGEPALNHPVFVERAILIEEAGAPAPITKLYEDLKRTLELRSVTTAYLAIARWPDLLESYWGALKPIATSATYVQMQGRIAESALQNAAELPGCCEPSIAKLEEAGLEGDEIADLLKVTEYCARVLSGLMLNIEFVKIGLEGGSAEAVSGARRSEIEPAKAVRKGTEPTQAA